METVGRENGGPAVNKETDSFFDGMTERELLEFVKREVCRHSKGMRLAVEGAVPALERLVTAMSHKSTESYKLRALLFSLWNGKKPACLIQLLGPYGLASDHVSIA